MNLKNITFAFLSSLFFLSPLCAGDFTIPLSDNSNSALSQMYKVAEDSLSQPIEKLLESISIPEVSVPEDIFLKNSGNGAIILTVPGIKASSIWSYIFGRSTKDGVPIPETQNGTLTENDKWLKEHFELPTDESYKNFKEEVLEMAEVESRYSGDDYLEKAIKSHIPDFAQRNIYIENYVWSRNALDSAEALPGLIKKIENLSEKAVRENKPFYIWAHSWGTLLSHTALHRINRTNPGLTVAIWVTCGSPLVPSNKIVRTFASYMIAKGGLEKTVSQPGNVVSWVNVWGKHDLISNEIKQCHINYEMDKQAKGYEKNISIWSIPHGVPDWIRMKNPIPWHSSYHEDFHTYLKSLKVNVDIPVFMPYIQPALTR